MDSECILVEIKNPNQVINNEAGYGQVLYNNDFDGWPDLKQGGSLEMFDSSLEDYNELYGASNWKISRVVGVTPGV